MKTQTLLALAFAVTLLVAARAEAVAAGAESAAPLSELLATARTRQRPVLIDFGAVWCVPCKLLERELAKPEMKPLLDGFVTARYDAERGEGRKAAERYEVHAFPTLIVVDADGVELAREEGLGPDVKGWLALWTNAAGAVGELEARAQKGELDASWSLAARAQSAHDVAGRRKWLKRIEADDHTPERKEAARAGWQLAQLDATAQATTAVRPILLDFIKRYPTHALQPLDLLEPAGVDAKTIAATFERSVQATQDPAELNLLVYCALDAGALDAALHAGERQVQLLPADANALDTLAEVWNARGEAARAVELEQKALTMSTDPALLSGMRANLARFQRADREPHGKTMASLSRFVFGREKSPPQPPRTAAEVASTLFWHESEGVAKACAAKAPAGLDKTYVRLHVGASPHAEKIELLEPRASALFKRCMEKAVRAIDVPTDSEPADVVIAFTMAAPKPPAPSQQ